HSPPTAKRPSSTLSENSGPTTDDPVIGHPSTVTVTHILVLGAAALAFIGSLAGALVWDDRWLLLPTSRYASDSVLHCFTQPFLGNYFRPLVALSLYLERQ